MTAKRTEKAAALDRAAARRAGTAFLRAYDVIYIGGEFCQNLLPSGRDAAELFEKGARKMALLTPFLTDEGLRRAGDAVSAIVEAHRRVEIIVNDFGLLAYLNKFHPRVPKGIGRPLSVDFLRMDAGARADFFSKHGIDRLETDETDMLHNIPPTPGFKVSLHYPLRFAAMSRYCSFAGGLLSACGQKCRGKALRLPVGRSGGELIAFENAYFTEHDPGKRPQADRLVRRFLPGEKLNG